jgi:chemotaxis protein histidine kinase CheA
MARVEEEFDLELAAERDSYLRELLSNLEELETVILDLSAIDNETEQTRVLTRQIHTIKGTAGSLGLDLLSAAAHRMEDLFADQRRRKNSEEKFIDNFGVQITYSRRRRQPRRPQRATIHLTASRSRTELFSRPIVFSRKSD